MRHKAERCYPDARNHSRSNSVRCWDGAGWDASAELEEEHPLSHGAVLDRLDVGQRLGQMKEGALADLDAVRHLDRVCEVEVREALERNLDTATFPIVLDQVEEVAHLGVFGAQRVV